MSDHPGFQSLAIDFRSLDIFQAVYARASMTDAARDLEMTQSAVSQAISGLEKQLGLQLFHRTRPLQATSAATELATLASRLFIEAQRVEARVRERALAGRPVLRVGMVDSFTATVGPKLIPRLRGVTERLTVWSGISRNLEKDLLAGKLDMIIGSHPLTREKGIVSYPLLTEPFFIVLPDQLARSMITSRGEVLLNDLVLNHTFVRYSLRSKIGADIELYLEHLGLIPPQSLEFDGTEAAFSMVKGGLGWMISTPLCLIHGTSVESGLTATPLPVPAPDRSLFLVAQRSLDHAIVLETLEQARGLTERLFHSRLKQLAPWALASVQTG